MRKKTSKYRSGLEEQVAQQLVKEGIDPLFETLKFPYSVEEKHIYTPDFPVGRKIIIETKGRFRPSDRMKMLEIKKQYPEYDFRFVFSSSSKRILKTSKTTYGMWCEKNGFKYADRLIPDEWLQEIKEEIK